MRFKGETVICDECGAEIREDNNFSEDYVMCRSCAITQYQEFLKSPCQICGKPMSEGSDDVWYNCDSDYAHSECIKTLTDKQIEDGEWTNEY